MITSRRIAIDGAELDQVDGRIVIQSIEPRAGKDTFGTIAPYGRPGMRVTAQHRDSLDLIVRYAIQVKANDMAARSEIFDKVNTWARSAAENAWITVGHKENRRLLARVVQYPDEGDQRAWTNSYQITFRAYEVPYWQDIARTSIRRANVSSIAQQLGVNGNIETLLDFSYTNSSGGTVNSITISTGKSRMSFSGLGLPNGAAFLIGHTETGRIKITANGNSAMAKRTPSGSDDDLWIEPGIPTITVTADRAGTMEFSCAGRYA